MRRFPQSTTWKAIPSMYVKFADEHGSPGLVMQFALGKVLQCSFARDDVTFAGSVHNLKVRSGTDTRTSEDRTDVPIDFRIPQDTEV